MGLWQGQVQGCCQVKRTHLYFPLVWTCAIRDSPGKKVRRWFFMYNEHFSGWGMSGHDLRFNTIIAMNASTSCAGTYSTCVHFVVLVSQARKPNYCFPSPKHCWAHFGVPSSTPMSLNIIFSTALPLSSNPC